MDGGGIENASRTVHSLDSTSMAGDVARNRSASCEWEEAAIHGTASGANVADKAIPCSRWLLQARRLVDRRLDDTTYMLLPQSLTRRAKKTSPAEDNVALLP
jgi:hypothetical protein